jgi:hypothetical protein
MLFLMFLTLFLGMLFLMCCSSWRVVPDVPHLVPGLAVPDVLLFWHAVPDVHHPVPGHAVPDVLIFLACCS